MEHAQARRTTADPVVVKVEALDGCTGYGETLARPYVTGEDQATVIRDGQSFLMDAVMGLRASSFAEALEQIEALPWGDSDTSAGQHVEATPRALLTGGKAARAAIELALLDVALRRFRRSITDVAGWMGLTWAPTAAADRPTCVGRPYPPRRARASLCFSGVLASSDIRRTMRQLRMYFWAGFRDFKLKVADDGDEDRLRAVALYLDRVLRRGRATLRIDANGAWGLDQARQKLRRWSDLPLEGVEQPLPRGRERELAELRTDGGFAIVHDESLVTSTDARQLIELGVADVFNIRISKCGGMMPALRMANLAVRHGVAVQLGCMVGETGILAGAGLRFLEAVPHVLWAEGCFGTYLLSQDVLRRSLRFGYAGRPPKLSGFGWGAEVDDERLKALCAAPPVAVELG